MLMVMIVLLMTTATATFAVHSTMLEIRSSGLHREAAQTQNLAEGGAVAALEYIDVISPQTMRQQYYMNQLPAGSRLAPEDVQTQQPTNVFRVEMTHFDGAPGLVGPPLELDAIRGPSLGPANIYVPRFNADVTDLHDCFRAVPGRRMDGHSRFRYMCVSVTARARLAPPSDYRTTGDARDFHETAINARATAEVGPVPSS